MNLGCHMSVAKGYTKAGKEALEIGANTFQFFTRNPRGGNAKALDLEDISKLKKIMDTYKFGPLFAHASYTMNLCSDKEEIREFAKRILKDDLDRLKYLPNSYYILHPGSHVKQGIDIGIKYIIDAFNEILTKECKIPILLETMSGKGSEIGSNLEELKKIIDGIKYNESIGICLDTCHLYSSGYDIVNDLEGVVEIIDNTVGIDRVKAIHLNDSKMPFGSNKDRHEVLGMGSIGLEAIIRIINHSKFKNKSFNLETPNNLDGYKHEIELLKKARVNR